MAGDTCGEQSPGAIPEVPAGRETVPAGPEAVPAGREAVSGGVPAPGAPRQVAVERLTAGDHACLGFDSHEDRWALRAAFATTGLARGERVMFFTDPATADGETLDRLAAHGVPVARARTGRRLEVVGGTHGYVPGRGFDAAARTAYWATVAYDTLALGFTRLRATGDMSWATAPDVDTGELARYEAALTPLLAKLGFIALCEYDRRAFTAPVLRRVLAAHPLSVPPAPGALHAVREESAQGPVLRLAGDADLATRTAFEQAVRQPGLAVIDLTGLAVVDAHCVRVLLRLPAGTVVECTAAQHRLISLCGGGNRDGVVPRVRRPPNGPGILM
jgi:hypothetical protein